MSIQTQAARLGFSIIGRLSRRPELEKDRREAIYTDEAGNRYLTRRWVLTIITAEGAVI